MRWMTIGVVIILAAILRLINLDSLPIFADEAIYVRWAQVMRAESTLRFLPLSDGKQPLFMWLTIPALKFVSDPLVAGRLVSAMAGLATVVAVGVAAWLLFKSWRPAVIAAAIYAALPYAVFFDRMALVDSLLTMWMIWGWVFFLLAVQHLRWDLAMLAGFCFGFAWLTKSPAVFGLALLPTLLVMAQPKKLRRAALLLIPVYIIAGGMYNILRLGPEFHLIAARNRDYVYSWKEILAHPLDPLVPHLKDSALFYLYLATPVGLLLAGWGVLAGKWQHVRSKAVLAAWWLGPIVVAAAASHTLTARYLLFTLPFAVLLVVHALEHIGNRTDNSRLTWLAAGLLVAIGTGQSLALAYRPQSVPLPRIERAGYLEQWTAGFGIKESSETIREAAAAGPVVVGSEGFFGTPFNALQLYLNDVSNVRVVGVGAWVDRISPDLISAAEENQVFLVINSTRLHLVDPEKEGLQLLASFPKAVPPDGQTEYLLFFKLNK